MQPYDSSPQKNTVAVSQQEIPANQTSTDVTPPVGITPPQLLAQQAAEGRRGAAWRLLYWIMENDPRTVIAISSLEDDRLAEHLLEFIAVGTWAGKSFVVPPPLRTPHARTRLRTLFLPGSGMDSLRAERVALRSVHDKRPSVRETAIHILGLLESQSATPVLIEALHDPVPSVRLQAAKALGRVGDPAAVPALLSALRNADEQLGSAISGALVQLGPVAVPDLIEASSSNSDWLRWQAIRTLAELCDGRALPVLAKALADTDHSIAWMGAKGLVRFGSQSIAPVLRQLSNAEVTPWLVETASYVLNQVSQRQNKFKPYLEPLVQQMHAPAFRVSTPFTARKVLDQLVHDRLIDG